MTAATLVLLATLFSACVGLVGFGIAAAWSARGMPRAGVDGPRQARRLVIGIGLVLAGTTSACFIAGVVWDMPTLVTASLVIGLEELWEMTMLTALLTRAARIEDEHEPAARPAS